MINVKIPYSSNIGKQMNTQKTTNVGSDTNVLESKSLERDSVLVLRECIELQNRKGSDYQAKESSIRQADYYVHGVETIYDIMWAKMLRLRSVMEKAKSGSDPNFESMEDTCKDLINYTSFFASYLTHKVDGQDITRDIFNRKKDVRN